MQTRDSLTIRRTVPTLMALALLGWTGSQPAFAQATPKKTDSVARKEDREKQELMRKAETDWNSDENDPALVDPAPMTYPFAAPGSLHLNHWTDYTRRFMAPGSAQEEREARRELLHKRMRTREERTRAMLSGSSPSAYDTGSSAGFHRSDSGSYNTAAGYQSDNRSGYQGGSGAYNTSAGYQSEARSGYRGGSGSYNIPAGYQSDNRYGYAGSQMGMADWSPMATFGDSIFLVRGNTLFKLNSSDLSVTRQQELPAWTDSSSGSGVGSSSASSGSTGSFNSQSNRNSTDTNRNAATSANNGSGNTNRNSSTNSQTGNNNSGNRIGTSADNGTSSNRFGTGANNGANGSRAQGSTDTSGRPNGRRSNGTGSGYSGSNSGVMNGRMYSGMGSYAPVSLTAANDFVYILRGNTLLQMRASDLSLVSRKQLPSMSGYGDSQNSFGSSNGNSDANSHFNGGNGTNSNGATSNGNNRRNNNRNSNGSGNNNPNSNGNNSNSNGSNSSGNNTNSNGGNPSGNNSNSSSGGTNTSGSNPE